MLELAGSLSWQHLLYLSLFGVLVFILSVFFSLLPLHLFGWLGFRFGFVVVGFSLGFVAVVGVFFAWNKTLKYY